jgi:alpha-mannosidase
VKFGPAFAGARVVHRGPLRAEIDQRWKLRSKSESCDITLRFIIDADAPFVRVHVQGDNRATDHRLRIGLATGCASPRVFADAMFGPVERAQPDVPEEERKIEKPLRTAPLHRYLSVFDRSGGATVYSDGLAEYEVTDDGAVFITVVRAVGELSRADLPERPGNAGWPTPTPGAQCPGAFAAELALLMHGPRSARVIGDIERTADDVLLPLTGATLRSALQIPAPMEGLTLSGRGLAFGCAKQSDDGLWSVVRCVNLLDTQVDGRWQGGFPVTEACRARLDETPGEPVAVTDNAVPFAAGPREVVTILFR